MSLELYQITLIIAVVCLIVELFSGIFLFLGFAIGLGVVASIHFFTGQIMFPFDFISFVLVSAASFWFIRRKFRRKKDSYTSVEDVNRYWAWGRSPLHPASNHYVTYKYFSSKTRCLRKFAHKNYRFRIHNQREK
jgi:hypothetical protein